MIKFSKCSTLYFIFAFMGMVLIFFCGAVHGAEPEEEEPLEIEIETTVKGSPLEKFMVTTSVIDVEEIERAPVRDIQDLLRDQNGVFSPGTANKKGKADIAIRGFGLNYIRVFMDGVPLNTANDRSVDFSLIPPEIIERIEVIKGPAPVTYGSDSMGGIINIVTKKGRDNKGASLRVSGGGYGTFRGSATLSGGAEKMGYFVMAQNRRTDGYTAHTKENLYDIFLKTDFDLTEFDNLSFMFFNTGGDREAPNPVNPDGSIRLQTSGFWTGSRDWEYRDILQQGFSLKLERDAKEKPGYFVNLYYKKYNDTLRAYVDPGTPIKPGSGNPLQYYQAGVWNYSYWNSYTYGGDARFVMPAGRHRLTVGAGIEKDFFRDTYTGRTVASDPPGSLSMPMDQWTADYMNPWTDLGYTSFYLQDEMKLNENITFTLGLRNDSFSESKSSLNGIANLVYANNKDTWRATAGKTGRFPSLKELYGKGGNPELLPERAWNYEIGYRHREPQFVDFEASVFHSAINNLIQPANPNESFSTKENISRVKILGAEANIVRKWKNLQGRAGYSYVHRVSPPLTSDWEEYPMHTGLLDLRWEKEKNICWAAQGVIVGSKKTGDPDIERLPGYGICNVMLAYPSFGMSENSNWNFELKITNLFDRQYQDRLYYNSPGRWVTGSVKYCF